jgi:hypothetical protein
LFDRGEAARKTVFGTHRIQVAATCIFEMSVTTAFCIKITAAWVSEAAQEKKTKFVRQETDLCGT